VQVKDGAGKTHIPDGAIIVERGKTRCTCLVEVKTGSAQLAPEQVNRYLDWARENRLDGVLTISNQITASAAESPVSVDGRKLRTTRLHHLSWWRIITEAIVQHRHRGVDDPDQAWLLGELIAYLDDERSGASGFEDMGENWVKVRTAVSLAGEGRIEAAIRVPDAVGPVLVQADLRTRKVITSVTLDALGDGRPATRVNWLLRQLKEAPTGLLVEVSFANSKSTTAALLSAASEDPGSLLLSNDPKRQPRSFRLALSRPMGTKRGRGERSFVLETRRQAVDFYRELVQDLRPWRASAPRLPDDKDDAPTAASSEPPAFSSEERDPTEAEPVSALMAH
jgi:hypothetical protein